MKHFVLTAAGLLLSVSLLVNTANAQCTGTANPTVTGGNDNTIGSLAWANPQNIQFTDGQFTEVSNTVLLGGALETTTQYLTATNLGFNIPSTSTICGISVTVNRTATFGISGGSNYIHDASIQLIQGGVIGSNDYADIHTPWPVSSIMNPVGTPVTYGGTTDAWGLTLTPADVNSANFGVAFSALIHSDVGVISNAMVDQVVVTVYASAAGVLPVHIQSFTVVAKPNVGNVLDWKASANDAGNRMVVERSADGVNWEELTVMTAGELEQDYTYTDATPLLGNNFYRLHLLNSDGSVAYSQVVKVDAGNTPAGISLYPNPIVDMINVTGQKAFSRLVLHDLQGKTLYVKEYSGGVNSAQIPASNLPAGLYFVQVDGTTYKVVKK